MFVARGMYLPMIAVAVLLQLAFCKAAPVPPLTWRQCGDQAFFSHQYKVILHPSVRHEYANNSKEVDGETGARNPQWPSFTSNHQDILLTHIAATRSRVADLAASACPGAHQPTLVFTTIGGFGDRLKGMVTTYYAALLTHAQFRMSWTVPAPIAPYFDVDPALLWEVDEVRPPNSNADYDPSATHLTVPGSAVVDVIDAYEFFTDRASDFVTGLAPPANGTVTVLRTNAPSWMDVVRHPTLRKAAELYGLTDLSRRDLFVLAMQAVLRRPAPAVIEAAVTTLPPQLQAPVSQSLSRGFEKGRVFGQGTGGNGKATPSTTRTARRHRGFKNTMIPLKPPDHITIPSPAVLALVAVQIRTGGIGEAWTDSEHRHPVDAARCFADRATEVCADVYAGACAVFLTADSRAAAAVFEIALNGTGIAVAQTDGPILHTDRGVPANSGSNGTSSTSSMDPWLKTYADWAALSQADVLLMSHSGYGLTAAWAGSVPHVWQLRRGEGACEWVQRDECAQLPM